MSKPQGDKQSDVKSGDYLRRLGAQWRGLSDSEKEPYRAIARLRQASASSLPGEEDPEPCDKPTATEDSQNTGAGTRRWGLGRGSWPLAPALLASPEMNNQFADAVNNWVDRLSEQIKHDESALPYKQTKYDTPCLLGACCQSGVCKGTSAG